MGAISPCFFGEVESYQWLHFRSSDVVSYISKKYLEKGSLDSEKYLETKNSPNFLNLYGRYFVFRIKKLSQVCAFLAGRRTLKVLLK